jgi:hypothetical protein
MLIIFYLKALMQIKHTYSVSDFFVFARERERKIKINHTGTS